MSRNIEKARRELSAIAKRDPGDPMNVPHIVAALSAICKELEAVDTSLRAAHTGVGELDVRTGGLQRLGSAVFK